MVAAFIDSAFVRKDVQQSLQTAANLLLMFLWEIFMIFPEKRWMHYVPSYIQDFLAAGLFMGSFGGAYMDLYYSFPAYDLVMHSVGGVLCTFVGYEILVCMQKRDKVKVDLPIVIFGAFGISFFAGTAWELFEFVFDQVAPQIGDAQHWSLALAEKAAEEHGNLIDRVRLGYVVDMLDTMFMDFPVFNVADVFVVCGTVCALIYYLAFYSKSDEKNWGNKVDGTDPAANK